MIWERNMIPLFNFLRQYKFHQQSDLINQLQKCSSQRLTRFAERYYELTSKQPSLNVSNLGLTDIYPDSSIDEVPRNLIKQFSIYAKRIYIHDPLLKVVVQWLDKGTGNPYFRQSTEHRLNNYKRDLHNAILYLLYLRPLIENEIIFLVSSNITPPNKDGSIYASDFYSPDGRLDQPTYVESLPASMLEIVDQRLKVYKGQVENGEIVLDESQPINLFDESLKPTDKICFMFLNDEIYWSYHLSTKLTVDKETRKIRMFLDSRDGVTVNEQMFRHWVEDKKRQVVNMRVGKLMADIVNSQSLGATFITNSIVSRDLALTNYSDVAIPGVKTLQTLGQVNLPYFENASLESIVEARQNEASFIEFGSVLEKAFQQIDTTKPESQIQAQELIKDIITSPLARIDEQMKSLQKTIFRDSGLLTVGTLLGSIALAGKSFHEAAAILAATGGFYALDRLRKNREERLSIAREPAFFYWQATRKGK